MMRISPITALRQLFPAERMRDWYSHVTNQGAHGGVVGTGLALVALTVLPAVAAWVVATLAYLTLWEIDGDAWDWADSLDDAAHVAAGAGIICGLAYYLPDSVFWQAWATASLAWSGWAVALAYGAWRRMP